MMKSRFIADLVSKGLSDEQAMIAAGLACYAFNRTWDPEPEPMAELLYVTGHNSLASVPGGREASDAELAVAASLYNRRKVIQQVAAELRGMHPGAPYNLNRLADRLEGK